MQCVVGGDEIVYFKAWYPHRIFGNNLDPENGFDAMIYVWPNSTAKYLWCQTRLSGNKIFDVFGGTQPSVGDVWLFATDRLFFVGPYTTSEAVYVHANWECGEVFLNDDHTSFYTRLFQPGPREPSPPPFTEAVPALDRLLGERELV